MLDYLTVADVLAIHEEQIAVYGGSPGIRDLGLLEAALYRPQTGYYDGLTGEAAALWESLSQNHPFIDGNKRVAFAAMLVFLEINGSTLSASLEATQAFVCGLYENETFSFAAIKPWLDDHVTVHAIEEQ